MPLLWAGIAALLIISAQGQQPAGTQLFVNYPGLSDSCKEALATNVTCPPFLPVVSPNNVLLNEDQASQLCVDACYSSLVSVRETIQSGCTASTDVIVYEDVAYPATFVADNYLLTYKVSCRKDGAGNYCDPQILAWSNDNVALNEIFACSDCWLGALVAQLDSPLGYDEGIAENFDALTSSCNVNTYSYTSPTAYALNATATATPTATPVVATPISVSSCLGSYQVDATDNCNSVAKGLNVSTYSLLHANDLDLYCQTFADQVGNTLCVPSQCTTYTWQAYDTCDSVVVKFDGVTLPQFLAWNPNFNSLCLNSPFFIGYEVCVSPPGGYLNNSSSNDSAPKATAGVGSGLAAVPTNALAGSNRNCSQWYTVVEGDDCALVSLAQSISLTDLYFLNPEIDRNCTNLELGEAYCVKPIGSITSYPNYTLSGVLPITITPAIFLSVNTAIPTSTNDPGYGYVEPTVLPTAPGTISGCYLYANPMYTSNLCQDLAAGYDVTFADLVNWNPGLENNIANCTTASTYSYCVQKYENSSWSSDNSYSCLSINATEVGTASNCNCFTSVDTEDIGENSCADLAGTYTITLAELLIWNTWLSGDCDTALFANLSDSDSRAVCVGVGPPNVTATVSATHTASVNTVSSATAPAPIQAGVVSRCERFYTVKSGDTCPSVENKFGITAAQFYQWNPSIGSTCTNLWLGYAYCVEGPASSPTTSSASAPTQTGITSNCESFHTVVSGDSCAQIETTYGITFAELYKWNPAIGWDCQTLEIGYAVCVGVSS